MTAIDEIDVLITMMIDRWEVEHPGIDRPNVQVISDMVLLRIADSDCYAALDALMQKRVNDRIWEIAL